MTQSFLCASMLPRTQVVSGSSKLRGFSLVEMMLALTLGLMLFVVMFALSHKLSRAQQWQQASSDMDLSGSRGLLIIAQELRMAGFFAGGIPELASGIPGAPSCGDNENWPLQPYPSLEIYAVGADGEMGDPAGGELGCLPLTQLQPDSDVVALKRVADQISVAPGVGGLPGTSDGYWYLHLAEDRHATWVRAGADGGADGSSADFTAGDYWQWSPKIFYVRRYSVSSRDSLPTLCVEQLTRSGMRSECLLEGIESMHFERAVDDDGDGKPDRMFLDAGELNVGHATHVSVFLLVRSMEAVTGAAPDAKDYELGSRRVRRGGDGYLRRVFSLTVPLPNQRFSL